MGKRSGGGCDVAAFQGRPVGRGLGVVGCPHSDCLSGAYIYCYYSALPLLLRSHWRNAGAAAAKVRTDAVATSCTSSFVDDGCVAASAIAPRGLCFSATAIRDGDLVNAVGYMQLQPQY